MCKECKLGTSNLYSFLQRGLARNGNMADSSEASSLFASGIVLLAELAAERRKKYISERDKTKISLFKHFESWRNLQKQLNLKADKELAGVLLGNYFGKAKDTALQR